MANFSAIAVALFCFFVLSLAVTPLNTPENDDFSTAVSLLLPDANPTVSSNPSELVNAEDNLLKIRAVPLDPISLRPFYRRFSKYPCHNRHKFYKADPLRPLEIPYGNDMLVSSGENSDFQNPETLHGGSWQRVKLHHHHHHHHHDEDSDSDDEDDDRIQKIALKRRHFGGLDEKKKLNMIKRHFRHEHTEEKEHHHKKEREGFMIRVRKFLDHYF